MDSYEEALSYIHSLPRFSGKPSLERVRMLLDKLGNPQDGLKFIHVAGTNGKGSTSAMTAEVLKQAGYKTGLFISPYILDFRERIQINSELISKEELIQAVNEADIAVKDLDFIDIETIGEFEFITAIALKYFEKCRCDIVVLEVGIGGKFDATNIINTPEVCAITSISLDHMAILGDTLPRIAEEKCGIIKPMSSVVIYPCQTNAVYQTISKNCKLQDASIIIPNLSMLTVLSSTIHGSDIVYRGLSVHLPLIGEHQIYNCIVVLEILFKLRQKGWSISDIAIQKGICDVRFPGRLEVTSIEPLIILDGAHNEGGVTALCKAIDTYLADKRIYMVLGMVSDKAYESCIRELASRAYMVLTVEPNTPRALDSSVTAHCAFPYCSPVSNLKKVDIAICKALELVTRNDVLLVCGSLYLMGDAKKTLSTRHKVSQKTT